MLIRLDRDSVAAGDDVDLHVEDREVDGRRPLERFVADLVRERNLPPIEGGRSCWVVRTERRREAVGVISIRYGDFDGVRLIGGRSLDLSEIGGGLFFEYAAQDDPDDVLARLLEQPR